MVELDNFYAWEQCKKNILWIYLSNQFSQSFQTNDKTRIIWLYLDLEKINYFFFL